VKRLEFLDGGTSALIGFDDRFVGTRISALARVGTSAETPGSRMAERTIGGGYQLSPTSLTRVGCVRTLRALLAKLAAHSFDLRL
jgi:hypothetical protein